MLSRLVSDKTKNSFKHGTWSAPAIMTAILIIGMMLIYGFESLGLSQREKNVSLRQTNPEVMIKMLNDDQKLIEQIRENNKLIYKMNKYVKFGKHDLNKLKLQAKEKNTEKILNLLLDGAITQHKYDIMLDNTNVALLE